MKSPVNKEEFVTVLKVDSVLDSQEIDSSSFVTVVELEGCKGGSKEVTKRTVCQEEVIMYRLPGERLGMGLKFEGGMQATECVSHVYIQSIAPDSPASRTETSWNGLAEGDEILEIDGRSVNHMTRVDCVTTLKKAPVAIRLLILHGIPNTKPSSKSDLASSPNGFQMNHVSSRHLGPPPPVPALSLNGTQMSNAYVQNSRPHCYTDIMPSKSHCHLPEVPLSPPPVPPRKLKARKGSTSSSESSPPSVYVPKKPKKAETGVQRDNNNSKVLNDSDLDGCNQKSNTFLGTKLPGWEELMLRRFSASSLSEDIVLPVPSECHVDLVAEEDRRSMMNEYESDDTGSSASTVIERFSSAVGSVHSLVAKSNEKHSIDISQVLGPFEQLEKEIEADFSLTSRPSNNCSSKHSQENRVADDKPLTIVPVPELLTPPTNKTIEPPDIFKDSGPDLSESQNVSCPVVGQISEHPLDIDLSKKNLPINDPCEKRRIDGVDISAAESGYDCQHIYSEPILLETESEIQPPPKRKLTPPPVPPRKLKNGRRNSEEQLQNSKSDRYQDGLVDDDFESPPASMSFPIIGNLLQELEQLPEFHRSSRMHSSVDDKSSALPVPRQPKFPTTTNCTVVEDLENATKNDDTFIINENDSCIQSKVLGHIQTRHLNVVATEENLSVVSPPPVDAHSSTSPTSSPNHGQISSQGLQQVQWSNIKEVSRVQESQEKDEDDDEEEEENDDDDDNEKVNVGCHSVNGQEENLLLNVSCEVVAVIEKLSPHSKNVTGRLKSSTGNLTMDDQTNSYSLLDGDDHFLPTFSRLPPDGHEFPPNYLENDFAPPDAGDFLTPEKFRHYEKPLIDPPAAFQDTEALFIGMVQNGVKRDDLSLSRSNVDDHMQDVLDGRGFLDDASTMSSKSSEAGDTVVYEELPPPLPVMKLLSESSLSDGEVSSTDDPVDAEFFHGKSVLDTAYVITDDKPPPLPKSGPPIPPKRTLASKAPLPMERASKTEEHLMSVKDKIAMFTAKTEPSPNPPSPTKPRAAKRASLTIERLPEQEIPKEVVQVEISLIQTEVTPADEDSIPPPIPPSLSSETFESVVEHQSRHRTELVVHSPVPYMVDCYHDRSGSSLSTASSFSKSSDDLLSQDVDSSDVDESTIRAAPSLDHLCPPQSRHTISDLRRKHSSSSSGNQCSDNYKSNWSTSSTDSEVGRLKTKSMYSVLESKKQNVSKLKGLVIPSVAESEKPAVPATPDLPLIFSVDSIRLPKVEPLKHVSSLNDIRPQNNHNRPTQLPAALTANTLDIQKYSPAFKRKPFTLTKSDTEVLEVDKTDETDNSLNGGHLADGEEHLQTSDLKNDQPFSINSDWLSSAPPPLPTSLPPKVSMRSLHSHHGDSSTYADDLETTSDLDELQDIEDQESGISSIESPNVSIHNTPPGSPKEMHHSKQKMRSLDAGVLANGLDVGPHFVSQIKTPSSASSSWDPHSPLSDSDSVMDPRILKPNSVEAINRKNVLQSSRHSSGGFDDDYSRLSTSNVPETSFDRKSSLSSLSPPTSLEFKENSFKRYHSLDDKGTRHQEKKSPEKVDKKEGLLHSEAKRSSDISRESKSSLYSEGAKTVSDERWQELSRKYGSKNSSSCDKGQFRRSEVDVLDNKGENVASLPLSNKTSATDKKAPNPKHFKALAEKWEQITVEPNGSLPLKNMKSSASLSKSMPSIAQNGSSKTSFANILQDTIHTYGVKAQDSKEEKKLPLTPSHQHHSLGVSVREKFSRSISARPETSFTEFDSRVSKLLESERLPVVGPPNKTLGSTVLGSKSRPLLHYDVHSTKSRRSTSVNDLRQIFENQEMSMPTRKTKVGGLNGNAVGTKSLSNHIRMSSLDSTCSESDTGTPAHYGSSTSLGSIAVDHYGSISSLTSSTSLISAQELQQLIDEANQSLEESGTPSHEINVVVFHREIPGGSIGVTLAGGSDYDSKEITINRVISGGLADKDGRIQKGDRVLSINGKNLKGVTHREALSILKAPRNECVLVLSRSRSSSPQNGRDNGGLVIKNGSNYNVPRSPATKTTNLNATITLSKTNSVDATDESVNVPSSLSTIRLIKDASGLGFSLDGGKDSLEGDKPLTVKKIFIGGVAHKNGSLHVGDEVLSLNGTDVTKMARIEAWNWMRKLPDGEVTVVVRPVKQ